MAIYFQAEYVHSNKSKNPKGSCRNCCGYCFKPKELDGFFWTKEYFECPFFARSIVGDAYGRFFELDFENECGRGE